jgi:transposase InsO family protein
VNSHKNARLGRAGRERLVRLVHVERWPAARAAAACGVSLRTARKWLARFKAEGPAGLADRSARPRRMPRRLAPGLEARIAELRAARLSGPRIADRLALPVSTVGKALRRLGLNRLPPLTAPEPVVRYERERPGELLHVDAKRLGRIHAGVVGHRITGDRQRRGPRQQTGWETLHVAVDDCSRVAFAALLPDETAASAVQFLERAVAYFASLGVRAERVMTDNAWCYTQRRYAEALARLGLQHRRIRPYRPRTNGKAERFIQTALREWAYADAYHSSAERAGALGPFLATYNTTRPHTAHGRRPPITRLQGEQRV